MASRLCNTRRSLISIYLCAPPLAYWNLCPNAHFSFRVTLQQHRVARSLCKNICTVTLSGSRSARWSGRQRTRGRSRRRTRDDKEHTSTYALLGMLPMHEQDGVTRLKSPCLQVRTNRQIAHLSFPEKSASASLSRDRPPDGHRLARSHGVFFVAFSPLRHTADSSP
jgi:hypothetical protein